MSGDAVPFADTYRAAVAARGRLCVGIDPHPALVTAWGLPDDVDGLRQFTETVIEAVAPIAAVVKPQVAFFERFGSAGFVVLEQAIAAAGDAGALIIADAKRGDIGTTMDAYAGAWLRDESPLCADSVTVSPYLGFGALQPAVRAAQDRGRGVFVLARTSNPDGVRLQSATLDSVSVAQSVVDDAARTNALGPASVGLVVGATRDHGLDLQRLDGPILAPGVGAQGATADDVARVFDGVHEWVLPSVSRDILGEGPGVPGLRAAVSRWRDALEARLRTGV